MLKSSTRFIAFICAFVCLFSVGGVYATWKYSSDPYVDSETDISINIKEFDFTPDMPEEEASFLERLYDILNNDYSNEFIHEGQSMDYLLSTLDKDWTAGHSPSLGSFVGSMDPTTESKNRIDMLLQNVLLLLKMPLMVEVSKAPMLRPPITKTNVLRINEE